MKNQIKVIKLDEQQILSILSEYFNERFYATSCTLLGASGKDLRLICLASDYENLSIFSMNKECVDKKYSFTNEKGIVIKVKTDD